MQGKSLDFSSADFQSLFLEGAGQCFHIFYGFCRGAPLTLAKLEKPACLNLNVVCCKLQSVTEGLVSCSVSQQIQYVSPTMFIHVEVWVPHFFLKQRVTHVIRELALQDESVELISEESLKLSALRKLSEGSSLLGSAIMPDLDA